MNKKIRKELADKTIKLLKDYEAFGDVGVYYDGIRVTSGRDGKDVEEEVDVSTITKYCNKDTITICFEGVLYHAINYGDYPELVKALDNLFAEYGYYYDLGEAWNMALYKM